MDDYVIWLLLAGVACCGATWLPHLLQGQPLSAAMVYVGLGAAIFSLPLGVEIPDPLEQPVLVERLTELVVIVALMGVGLKIDRVIGWRTWNSTWRLLSVTMLLSIAALAGLGWLVLGLSPAAAILLGAVLAPTDPVLASDVQAAPPLEKSSGEVRFALTSESGLNDGLAFPFTNLAIVLAASSGGWGWLGEWLWRDVLYKISVGLVAGAAIGYALASIIFRMQLTQKLARAGEGIAAIAITLVAYAGTELLHGYGFLAVFVAALVIRRYESQHEYNKALHDFAENIERLLMTVLLIALGGALVSGLLDALTWQAVLVAVAFLLVIRPAAGFLGLIGRQLPLPQRAAIAFFGVRGIGSIYYLAYALNRERFAEAEALWAIVLVVITLSILLHGITAPWAMRTIDSGE